ncbi:PST family polysaccharide transporter/teichuronic acid exporter [Tenacibaculum gallaicum]|uniref:PST family polysaccharide transporter/teichuronic acid exporter n=1 Tax=Tenacibaculum gallaicum TaxID=561505 RepID=A0A3E0HH10_9FLAO|nr:MOP flippase family protein [Tenacibaculum gallaicum]REH45774.1 PST family polysaccharide transporter/teichuronic acid exporter [Tenacibaculum gallaicum]
MSINKQVKTGVKWTTISTIVLAVVAILKVSILTRFLDKADFGLMALVTFVMGFMNLFNDMGVTSAILHKQGITKNQYASLYWINWMVSIAMYVILFLITPLVTSFYEQPLLNTLIPLIGLNLLISGLGRQYKTIEQKHLLFNIISLIDIIGALLSLGLSVVLAVFDYGVFALVYSVIFQALFSNVCYFIIGIRKYGLLFHFKFKETKEFLKIGMYQVGGQVINYFNRDLDILIIGKFFSTDILGGYSLAKQLVFRPVQVINPILVKVAAPALALMQKNIQELKSGYLRLVNIVASINIPVYLGLIVLAPWVVKIMYGGGFDEVIILVRILSVYMMFRSIGNPVGSLVVATGRTDLEFLWNLITLFVVPVFIYFGSLYGILGVTISLILAMMLLYYPSWKILVNNLTGASFKEYFRACFKVQLNFYKLIKG